MDIYAILASKPHNPHYLKRYVDFIEGCQKVNEGFEGYTEKHHICPKAKDMFPEYASFKLFPWNCAILTARQHLIAHLILVKVYPDFRSQKFGLWKMFQGRDQLKNNSKAYEKARIYNSIALSERNKKAVKENKHIWQSERNPSKRLAKEGKHHAQTPEWRVYKSNHEKQKCESGNHPFCGDNNPSRKLAKEGKHHWQGGDHQRKWANKRVEEGTHNWQGDGRQQSELNAKRIADGTHNFLGKINCVDPDGNDVFLDKREYIEQQVGPKEFWFYVHRNSKEGYRRKGKEYTHPKHL